MDGPKVTKLPRRGADVSAELAAARNKIRFILESAYGQSVQKPLSLEASIGLGIILHDIDRALAEIAAKLGYDDEP